MNDTYFVLAANGQKYGPADVPTLAGWATEGRLDASTMLESAVDSSVVPAAAVPGVIDPSASTFSSPPAPQPIANYPRQAGSTKPTSTDMTLAWVFCAIGIAMSFGCCLISYPFSIAGLVFSVRAKQNGEAATVPFVLSIVGLVTPFMWFGMQAFPFGLRHFGPRF